MFARKETKLKVCFSFFFFSYLPLMPFHLQQLQKASLLLVTRKRVAAVASAWSRWRMLFLAQGGKTRQERLADELHNRRLQKVSTSQEFAEWSLTLFCVFFVDQVAFRVWQAAFRRRQLLRQKLRQVSHMTRRKNQQLLARAFAYWRQWAHER